MIHGSVPADFKKLVNQAAIPHLNEVLLRVATTMGISDDPNSAVPAGWTYFGQFVDHDLTFDKATGINSRTPIFDLDSLYGNGPNSAEHGHHFEGVAGRERFKIGNQANVDGDLIRDTNFVAQIPDPRNDENIIIASLQLLFQKFHNALVATHGLDFEQARRTVRWHYQSIVRFDFLPRIVGQAKLDEIETDGRKVFTASTLADVFMPVEYSGACYRFGHSMVRERYSFNDNFNDTRSNANLFFLFPDGRPVPGGHQITKFWTLQGHDNRNERQSLLRFFDPSVLNPLLDADNLAGKFDTKLPSILFNLEVAPGQNNALAHRNLISGQRLGLASGQQVAASLQKLGVTVTQLTVNEILKDGTPPEIGSNTPLWYYILREAEIQSVGEHLGQIGGTIVAETIIGLLESDPTSLLNRTSPWPFKVGDTGTDIVTMVEFIEFVDAA